MSLSSNPRFTALLVFTGAALFTARLPGHRPWAHGWEALAGGILLHYFAVAVAWGLALVGYRYLRPRILHDETTGDPLRIKLQDSEIGIVLCVTLLVVSVWVLLADSGALVGIADMSVE